LLNDICFDCSTKNEEYYVKILGRKGFICMVIVKRFITNENENKRGKEKRKKDDLIYLNVYLIFHIFFNPLSHNIHIQILHIDVYTFP